MKVILGYGSVNPSTLTYSVLNSSLFPLREMLNARGTSNRPGGSDVAVLELGLAGSLEPDADGMRLSVCGGGRRGTANSTDALFKGACAKLTGL